MSVQRGGTSFSNHIKLGRGVRIMLRKLLVEGKLAVALGLIIANLYIGFAARAANVDL